MSAKKPATEGNKAKTVVANDPDDMKGTLKRVGGSHSDGWKSVLANKTVSTLWLKHSDIEPSDRQISTTLAGLADIGPRRGRLRITK